MRSRSRAASRRLWSSVGSGGLERPLALSASSPVVLHGISGQVHERLLQGGLLGGQFQQGDASAAGGQAHLVGGQPGYFQRAAFGGGDRDVLALEQRAERGRV